MSAELQRAFDGHLPTDDSPDAADECTAVRTFFDEDGEGEPTLWVDLGLRGACPVLRRCDLRPQVRHLWPLVPRADVERVEAERDRARQVAVDLEAEVARLTRIVTDAALETYTPEGAEVVVQWLGEYTRRAERAEAENARLAVVLARVRALADATHDDHYEHLIRAALDGSDQS